jgi:hypothetical protein
MPRSKGKAPSKKLTNDPLTSQPANDTPPASPDASPPMTTTNKGVPYNILDWGGARAQIQEILLARPVWDEETVEEILRWGGTPKLHQVHNAYEGGLFTKVRCTFVHPSGALVENVWLPLSILKAEYGKQVSHLK